MDDRGPRAVRVTGIGSMPGTDSAEATRIVVGELDVPHIVELPARGPGADMIGRALGLVAAATGDFGGETTVSGWRLAGGRSGADPGRQMRRAVAWLGEDADRLEQELTGFVGTVKLQVAGPWTLAASVESVRGTRLLADAAACADLATALSEALARHAADIAHRIPGATVVVQLDEPLLPIVSAGGIRTPSGRGAIRTPQPAELVAGMARVLEAVTAALPRAGADVGQPVVPAAVAHCCGTRVPFDLFRRAGFEAISVDAALLGRAADDELGTWWESAGSVLLGVAPAVPPESGAAPRAEALARSVSELWGRIGFGAADVGTRTWLTPTCGLAGAAPAWARGAGAVLRRAAALLESAD